jgi:hypothetical protein
MRETSLRWGLGMGAIAAALGVIAQVVGAQFRPAGSRATFDQAIKYLLIAGPLVLIALGVALGLAYYAGLRAERDRPPRASAAEDELPQWGGERRDSAVAGALVMLAYWLLTSLYAFVLGLREGGTDAGSFLGQHIIQGILFLLFGYGLGALGGRAPAARKLLDAIAVAPIAPGMSGDVDAAGDADTADASGRVAVEAPPTAGDVGA